MEKVVGISGLDEALPLSGLEVIAADQDEATVRIPLGVLKTWIAAGVLTTDGDGSAVTARATGGTTTRLLRDRFRDMLSVRDFGAKGDGVTDDTAAFHAARDVAGAAGTVVVPPGTYALGPVTLSVPGQRWVLARGATLRLKAGANADLITVTADGVTICGDGVVDGNAAGQSAECSCIRATSVDRLTVSGVTVRDASNVGILMHDCPNATLHGVTVENTTKAAIVAFCVNVDVPGVTIDKVHIDRSGIVAHNGIQLATTSTTGKKFVGGAVRNCTVILHEEGSGLGIEFWNGGQGMVAVGNVVRGGAHAISFDRQQHGTASGNTVSGYSAFGIELAACDNTTVTGNTAIARGTGNVGTGVGVAGPGKNNTISGNTAKNNHIGLFIIDMIGTAVEGNAVEANGAGATGLRIQASDHTVARGNVLDGGGVGAVGTAFIDSSHVVFDGNVTRGWASHWLQITAYSRNVDFLYIGRNPVATSQGIDYQQQNGFSIGEHFQYDATQNYPAHYWGGATVLASASSPANNVLLGWSSETPNGRVQAGAGSIVLHRHPHAALNHPSGLWHKTQSGDAEGWLPVALVRRGPTANRPLRADGSALTADHTGMSYFDTTLGKPLWWSGTGWVDAAGAAA